MNRTPHQRARDRQIRTLLELWNVPLYDVGALDHATGRMSLREDWDRGQVLHAVGWMARRNATGSSIYARPAESLAAHQWVLVDALDEGAKDAVAEHHPPAAFVETNPDTWQAWIRLDQAIDTDARADIGRRLLPARTAPERATTGRRRPLDCVGNLLRRNSGHSLGSRNGLRASAKRPLPCISARIWLVPQGGHPSARGVITHRRGRPPAPARARITKGAGRSGAQRGAPARAQGPREAAGTPAPGALERPTPRDTTHENRACCEIAPPPGRGDTPWARPGPGRGARSANDVHARKNTTATTEWCVRQRAPAGNAIVRLRAPTAAAAVKRANERVGPLGYPTAASRSIDRRIDSEREGRMSVMMGIPKRTRRVNTPGAPGGVHLGWVRG